MSRIRQALKHVSAAADRVSKPHPGIVVLIYHRVGARTTMPVDMPTATFDEEVAWLAEHTRVLSLDDAVEELQAGEAHAPGVVLTFDDGTADWVDEALPVLDRHQVPATFYVATEFVDQSRPFDLDGQPITWGGLAEMASNPLVTLGSHTHSHALLDRLPATQVAGELDRSIELLGAHTGAEVAHFAYPKALAGSPAADAEVRARFRSAALAGTKANVAGRTDVHRLARTPIQNADHPRWFEQKVAGGLGFEERVRDTVNRVRYARATT